MRRLVVALLVLLVVLVVADRGGEELAERAAAQRLAAKGYARDPSVEIDGIPFLTQLVVRRFQQVRVSAPTAVLRGATVDDVALTARDVQLLSRSEAQAGTVSGSFVVPYSTLASRVNLPGRIAPTTDGQLRYTATIDLFGRSLSASITSRLSLQDSTVVLRPSRVEVPGGLAEGVLADLASRQEARLNLSGLPAGLGLRGLSVTPAGILVRFAGSSVRLP